MNRNGKNHLNLSCCLLVNTLTPLKPFVNTNQNLRELLGYQPLENVQALVWWLVLISHRAHSTFSFSLKQQKWQQCFCCSSHSRLATWQVSARCLAFCTQSGLAISSVHTDTNTLRSSSSSLTVSTLFTYITSWTFHHRPDIVLRRIIPVPRCVFV